MTLHKYTAQLFSKFIRACISAVAMNTTPCREQHVARHLRLIASVLQLPQPSDDAGVLILTTLPCAISIRSNYTTVQNAFKILA
jgi:hypothetical protein